ncbi:MAG: hypothetical protein IPL26_12325 [Leptospiraceae bacterium]|nr:hypothetical protein [Leptospiraceae bacterium]
MLEFESIYFYTAAIGTFLFVLKLLLSFFGSDTDSIDMDALDPDNLDFKFLSLQTISIFAAAFGWMGMYLQKNTSLAVYLSLTIATVFGLSCSVFEIWLFAKVKGLSQINKLDLANAIGKVGKVYMTIPEYGVGEIQVSFQGSMKNLKAISKSGEKISAFEEIKVSSVKDGILVVERL